MNAIKPFAALCALALVTAGCGKDGEAPARSGTEPVFQAQPQAPVGHIEIDGQIWNVITDVQCSVAPGPTVAIAGHAAGDEGTEIVVDFNLPNGPTGVSVVPSDGSTEWHAESAMNFDITGKTVKGTGYFAGSLRSSLRQAQGRFEITCR
ncbi:hypothetical protein [Arenimonas sp.]|uniref:hypothetical protein n=1 Tax=Arenimonas sp. TaxID=1872635 RepID=UPI0035AE2996